MWSNQTNPNIFNVLFDGSWNVLTRQCPYSSAAVIFYNTNDHWWLWLSCSVSHLISSFPRKKNKIFQVATHTVSGVSTLTGVATMYPVATYKRHKQNLPICDHIAQKNGHGVVQISKSFAVFILEGLGGRVLCVVRRCMFLAARHVTLHSDQLTLYSGPIGFCTKTDSEAGCPHSNGSNGSAEKHLLFSL